MAQMRNAEEQMKKFDQLYAQMAASTNIENMKLFGKACRKAIEILSTQMPARSMEIIDELCAMNWDNYVTDAEVEKIVRSMNPVPKWGKEQVVSGLMRLGLPVEESPYYNTNALYVTISMKYSDSAKTVAETILKRSLGEVDDMEMLKILYHLAKDVLKDPDKRFRVRKYFDL